MAAKGDDLTNCPVCFEDYTEDGDHIPRILPCSHSLCEGCLEVLLRGKKIDCPECREKHVAGRGIQSFPQNKYIVSHLQRTKPEETKVGVDDKLRMCRQHDRVKSLFCKDVGCQKALCPVCLARFHKGHSYVDLEEQKIKCKPLSEEIQKMKTILAGKRKHLLVSQEDVEKQRAACKTAVETTRDQVIRGINKKFLSILGDVDDDANENLQNIYYKITEIDKNISFVQQIEKSADIVAITDEDIADYMTSFTDMKEQDTNLEEILPEESSEERVSNQFLESLHVMLDGPLLFDSVKECLTPSDIKLTGIYKYTCSQILDYKNIKSIAEKVMYFSTSRYENMKTVLIWQINGNFYTFLLRTYKI